MSATLEQLRQAAKLLGHSAYAAYMTTLRGDVPAGSSKNFEPCVGQWVMETSAWGMFCAPDAKERYAKEHSHVLDPLNFIGVLGRIVAEPSMSAEQWNEGVEDKNDWEPVPTEKVYYIKTLDGRDFNWRNCRFIRIPDSHNFRVMNLVTQ